MLPSFKTITFSLCTIVFGMSLTVQAAGIMNLGTGDARPLSFKSNIGTVFISNPEVADYQVIDNNRLVVFGRDIGTTTLIIFGESSEELLRRKIAVNQSLTNIEQTIAIRYPDINVSVLNLGEQVVLSGFVPTQKEKNDIYSMVGELLNKEFTEKRTEWKTDEGEEFDIDFMARRYYRGLVNNLEVSVTKQVNVKLTIAEVNSALVNELGIEWGTILTDGFAGNGQFFRGISGLGGGATNVATFISAINDDSVGQILSEPNVSVISGESASFLVGGEIPVTYRVDDGYRIQYKEFGIGLDLAAEVLRDDKIKLAIQPQVSSVDAQFGNTLLDIPSFKVRRARTTLELGDGQSFILGGLLSTEDQEELSKIPFIGDVPILGALFRNTSTTRRKTELIIVATVSLVEPISSSNVRIPSIQRTSTLSRFFGIKPSTSPEVSKWQEQILATGGFKK
ncbi:general secretion pathway protein GspD [Enterovibrio norvegicus]|nr:pilus assembly protein N-terminal domain-containing protein [Enterovibrio norvegicus]MCC4797722.1 pilus assembly protein N-terminal domain-containing protein [Enterovibrio norvegicus]PMH61024.1 general secretion pathway protein GspD [Enterovibrio norvegicus]PMI32739.1 general secretion pathway protein GspD [Enterovibrio norvegicus]PMI38811.1 general secretion pathway protein GspD [Enterovibrio norvegicus]PMN45570.1 general secretion pathway protein GspD [Enterovibrio norvegicus]